MCSTRRWRFDREDFTGCLLERVHVSSFKYLEAFYYFDVKNMFPNAGGWQDQPEKLLKAFNVIESERRKIRADEEKDDKPGSRNHLTA